MRKRYFAFIVFALSSGCAGGPAPIHVDAPAAAAPWTHLDAADDPDDFRFVVLGDRTGGHREGVFGRAIEAARLVRPAFVLSVGDLVEGNITDPQQLESMWAEFEALVAPLEAPFFHAPGNHDYSNEVMARDWTRRFGPSFYRFRYKDVLFLVLNSELFSSFNTPGHAVEGGATQEDQLRFVERALDEGSDARWTFVLMHQPLWVVPETLDAWEHVETLLGDRPYTVLAGHFHSYQKQLRNGREYIILGTAGGASRLRGVDRGEFDHLALVTMTDAGPVLANLMLDGVHDADVHDRKARALMGKLDQVVTTLPLRVEGEQLARAEQRFALENRADRPVTVRASFAPSPHFEVEPAQVERVLAPKSRESLTLVLRPTTTTDLARVTPALAHWSVETAGERGAKVVEGISWLIPERRFPVDRPSSEVAVDGDVAEWGRLRFAMEDWPEKSGGTASASLRFDVRADRDFLYLAFEVADDTPFSSPERSVLAQDGVTLEIDARPDPARSGNARPQQSLADGTLSSQLVVTLSPVEGKADTTLHRFSAPFPPGSRRAARRNEHGYTAELAVPSGFLDERAGGAWTHFRLNLVLHDAESPDGPVHEHAWRPPRYGDPGVVIEGAGTFERAGAGDR
jgi:hypothetical protein